MRIILDFRKSSKLIETISKVRSYYFERERTSCPIVIKPSKYWFV